MQTPTTARVPAALLAFLIGCGGSSKPSGDGSSMTGDAATDDRAGDGGDAATDGDGADEAAPASAVLACQALNEAAAQLGVRCSGGTLAEWQAYQAATIDCAAYDRHVAAGLVEYHPELLASCLQKFQDPCELAAPYPCQYEVLLGTVPDGQSCRATEVCGPVSACINLGGDVCGDICARFGNENEPCGLHCGPGPLCLEGPLCTAGLTCSNGTCVKSKQPGEACGGTDQIACVAQFYCKRADPTDATSTGICARPAPGGPCADDTACLGTYACQAGMCVPRRPAGAPCADAPTSCEVWTACYEGTGTCVPLGGTGEPCATFPGTSVPGGGCITGFCDGQTCQPLSFAGGSCAQASCVQGTFCDSSQTCVSCDTVGGAPRPDGGAIDAAASADF
jgi:hypothetical protein